MQAMKRPTLLILTAIAVLVATGCVRPDAGMTASPTAANASKPDPAHVARTSLDWAGSYRGLLPCADCGGIETVVRLGSDGSYRVQSRYRGRGDEVFTEEGNFSWNDAGNTVTLAGREAAPYFVTENRLIRLALDGSRITGALADNYVLDKLAATITDTRWQLVELQGRPVTELKRLPWLLLVSADSRVGGFGGCNGFSGTYEIDPAAARIRFGKVAATMMACADGMDVETDLHQVLGTVDNYSLAGDQLMLNRARMAPLARFEAVYLY